MQTAASGAMHFAMEEVVLCASLTRQGTLRPAEPLSPT